MASHKFFAASDEHRMITHEAERALAFMRNVLKDLCRAIFLYNETESWKRNRFKIGTGFVGFDILKWTSL